MLFQPFILFWQNLKFYFLRKTSLHLKQQEMYKVGCVDIFCLILSLTFLSEKVISYQDEIFRHRNSRNLPSALISRSMWLHAQNLSFWKSKLPQDLDIKCWEPEPHAYLSNLCEYLFLQTLCLPSILWTSVCGLECGWNIPTGYIPQHITQYLTV